MRKWEKVLAHILDGRSDANVAFEDLCDLLLHFGFELRTRGSHHLFRKAGIVEKVNLQKDGNQAKPYQVRQVRDVILKYRLRGEQ
jgi:predicted RNA binding protein YcfA (HicA-like mRNA interferase family)